MERIENVIGKMEKMTVPMTAKFDGVDPILEQLSEDDRLLKVEGDSRSMVQQGKITSPDGETTIDTDLTFIRTRNKTGGVDVICQVPSLGFEPGVGG